MATFEVYRERVCGEPYLTRAGAEHNVGMVREAAGFARLVDLTGE